MKEERYIRQTTLKDFGPEKQQLFAKAKVMVVGVGGLGIPVLQYLSAMGVGTLGMVEQDIIELSNLQRQVLYGEEDLGKQKIHVALDKLKRLNSETNLKLHDTFLTRGNALHILKDYDLIVDASDNFATRYLINDACVILDKPFVSGAIHGFEGQVSVFNYKDGPTYRCLFPSAPGQGSIPDCNENGVLGVIPGIVGTLQALEAIKVITQTGDIMSGVLLLYNGLDQSIRKIKFPTVLKNKQRKELEPAYEPVLCEMEELASVHSLNEQMNEMAHISIIDVRTSVEYAQEAIEGSTNVPLNEILDYFSTNPVEHPTYFICQTGIRSQQAIQFLRPRFPKTPMYSVIGGMAAWLQEVASTRNKS
ncbi:HesA/MoeB/ThiF family protein [uncultured Muriicola sp.]|uniref:HesA/MoeB/ThiF family protein n=1 Tax=uncultured Muriicola sp. TaxID=1583102 RepID=UPI002625DF24|nr:HesA/MoeB/ThiF family protein [uncultured Muriicola sp.]